MVRTGFFSQRFFLFFYFIFLITIGGLLLKIPIAWNGSGNVLWVDAFFTAVSAVCVTGLITVDTAQWSRFGQSIILFLIQLGGLGILAFTTLMLTRPGKKWSLVSSRMIRQYSLAAVEYRESSILRMAFTGTFLFEGFGALCLYFLFPKESWKSGLFNAVFHSVSAFCNAGFSLYPDSLVSHQGNVFILIVIMVLIINGGIGFVVMRDLFYWITKKSHKLSLHSRIVIIATFLLITIPALLFWIFERNHAFSGMSLQTQIVNSFFQAITPRTAGFNTVDQSALSLPGRILVLPLMFIGGAPGSMAGGVKVTTFALIVLALIKGLNSNSDLRLFRRRIPLRTITKAHMYVAKGLFIISLSIIALSLSENFLLKDIIFEVFSAIGTVGLSTGITADLSSGGKLIIMFTMFAGRVGLISMVFKLYRDDLSRSVDYPIGEVMIG